MRKGFTLIELLAVIVILAIIAIIATPIILGIIKDVKEEANQRSIDMYVKSIRNAIVQYQLEYKTNPTNFQQIEKYIKLNGSDVKCEILTLSEDGTFYLADCKVNNVLVEGYTYGEEKTYVDAAGVSVNVPTGLTPVIYKDGNWEIVSKGSKWFDYNNQEWANAVILNEDVSKDVGTKIYPSGDNTNIKAMFVYIPRYEYKIEGDYAIHTDGTVGTRILPGEIKVNFIPKSQIIASTSDYILHPSFLWDDNNDGSISDDEQLEGIWVGKFELSHSDLIKSTILLECIDGSCANADNLRILPNVKALRYNNVSNFFYGIRSMSRNGNGFGFTNVDTHMIKNSEWGAVAYLSQSKYGKYGNNNYEGANKEIYQNNSEEYITGMSSGSPSGITSSTECRYDNITNNCGIGASTTGNITGVYDMSGGSNEYVMGYKIMASATWGANSNENAAGFLTKPEEKYYEVYTEYEKDDIGHALSESSIAVSGAYGWYNDMTFFVGSTKPWFIRGGYRADILAGIYYSSCSDGGSSKTISTRVVLVQD